MTAERPVYIYGLADPRDGIIRYVGKSVDPNDRLTHHLYSAKRGGPEGRETGAWLRTILDADLMPDLVILETTTDADWQDAERRWITTLHAEHPLTNLKGGGFNGPGLRPFAIPYRPHTRIYHRKDGATIQTTVYPRLSPERPSAGPKPPLLTADEVREARAALGMSQHQLAHALGVSHSAVSRWESGQRSIPALITRSLIQLQQERAQEDRQP